MREASLETETRETRINVTLSLENPGTPVIATGLPFFDHMLEQLAFHGGIAIELACRGDLEVDDHHTVEDTAIALARALGAALGEKAGIERYGYAYVPLDESLVRAVVDLSGRPCPVVDLPFKREQIGGVATENIVHFFETLANRLGCALHIDGLRSRNDHHLSEAAFKAVGRALRDAVRITGTAVRSTKGALA